MNLRGQELPGGRGPRIEPGYAMAALLVAIAVLTVMLAVAMPVWRHEMQREREAELVFRGEQYVRALDLFQRKYPGTAAPSLDVLVSQRFLRKKYKDPMTEDGEFRLIYAGQAQTQPTPGAPGQGGPTTRQPGVVTPMVQPQAGSPGGRAGQITPGAQPFAAGGIIGVASKSKDKSIRLYKGRNKYDEWQFVFANIGARPGGGGGARQPGIGPGGGMPRPGMPGRPGQPGPARPGPLRPPGAGRPPMNDQRPVGPGPIPR